jgi:uncharacterized protein YggU (UPF0235/DUF167 family)
MDGQACIELDSATCAAIWRAYALDDRQKQSAHRDRHDHPGQGEANKEFIALVAEHFSCPRSAVSIKSGGSSRLKRVCIAAT